MLINSVKLKKCCKHIWEGHEYVQDKGNLHLYCYRFVCIGKKVYLDIDPDGLVEDRDEVRR